MLQNLLAADRQRRRHRCQARAQSVTISVHDFGLAVGDGALGDAGDGDAFGSCRISVRLGPVVVNFPSCVMTITVSGLVATCVFNPLCTRGVPRNSTLPSLVV